MPKQSQTQNHQTIIILDFGSRNNQLVARHVRDLHVYCEVLPDHTSLDQIKAKNPVGIILTSDQEKDASLHKSALSRLNIPLQFISAQTPPDPAVLQKFLFETCHCTGDWTMSQIVAETVAQLKQKIGKSQVLCALSGGVDSTVTATLIQKAVPGQLTCVLVDHGLMRQNEIQEVEDFFRQTTPDLNLLTIDASQDFLTALQDVSDPEQKRKIIGTQFIRTFEKVAKKLNSSDSSLDFLAQGTIYPDIIESGTKTSATIKSHHNVGGLPDVMDFKEIVEPLRHLFKDEVRQLGQELGLPEALVWRQPFPGPGLAIRIMGSITSQKLEILRQADAIFREEIFNVNLHRDINQYFAVLTDLKTVGVKNNRRTYDYVLALRAVITSDFMTADWAPLSQELLTRISTRILSEVDHISRLVYDITPKPPGTIEWE